MALDDVNSWTLIAQIVGVVVLGLVGTLWVSGIIWVANDVRRRTSDATMQWLSIGAAALLFVPGLILYIAMRPSETLEDRRERRWEMEFMAQQAYAPVCGNCQRRLRDDFVRCPYCAHELGAACVQCDRFNAAEWVVCAYCGTSKVPAAASRPMTPAATRPRPAVSTAPVIRAAARNGHTPAS